MVQAAHTAGLYTNLITSGVGLTQKRLQALVDAGLDHVQLSFQDSREAAANWIAGTRAHALKVELAPMIRAAGVAFTVNMVVHRQNLDHLEEMIAFAESLAAGASGDRARAVLRLGVEESRDVASHARASGRVGTRLWTAAQKRLAGRIRIDAVVPDYYARFPKACMGGWGQRLILINPSGKVLPCHAAEVIPGLQFENVRERPLKWIWQESDSFQKFRGEDWMPEPCRSCDRRDSGFWRMPLPGASAYR